MMVQPVRLRTRQDIDNETFVFDLASYVRSAPEQLVLQLPEPVRVHLMKAIRGFERAVYDDHEWPGGFDMLSRKQVEYVRQELKKLPATARRMNCYEAFLLMIGNIDRDTGEILLTRKQFAEELGILPHHVSEVMGTLERIGLVRRERQGGTRGGTVTYFVDANVAWNGSLAARKVEAAKSVPPSLRLVEAEAERSAWKAGRRISPRET